MKLGGLLKRAKGSPASLRFAEICRLAEGFGFTPDRQKGSHKIFVHQEVGQIMNFQDDRGMAKAYQVRQLLACVEKHGLVLGEKNE